VFDHLSFENQLEHQMKTWGELSFQISDYTERGLHEAARQQRGQELLRIVDPFTYRDEIKVPTLMVNGANDPYWQVDALAYYWNDLQQPKWVSIVPNSGHILADKDQKLRAIAALAKSLKGELGMPESPSLGSDGRPVAPGAQRACVWVAEADRYDFREARWREVDQASPSHRFIAAFASAFYSIAGHEFTLTSPAVVFPPQR
jgi:PhoPQ-activated pathogenicity-related protein